MSYGIDWFSTILFLAVYGFSRIPGVPARLGNAALAAACGFISWHRYSHGGLVGPNAIFVGIAAALGLYFVTKVFAGSGSTPRRKSDD
jgi:hypothetical protein